MRGLPIAIAALALFIWPSASARPSREAAPLARVGAFYFDGWSGTLGNFHWGGLLATQFSNRRPLSGWTDDRPEAVEAQLRWAHADGIGFFAFDWYYNPDPGNGPINMAHDTYLKLHDHDGVGFALNYVNQPGFVIPPDQWATVAEKWATEDFLNPDYVRIDGKPVLIILDGQARRAFPIASIRMATSRTSTTTRSPSSATRTSSSHATGHAPTRMSRQPSSEPGTSSRNVVPSRTSPRLWPALIPVR